MCVWGVVYVGVVCVGSVGGYGGSMGIGYRGVRVICDEKGKTLDKKK